MPLSSIQLELRNPGDRPFRLRIPLLLLALLLLPIALLLAPVFLLLFAIALVVLLALLQFRLLAKLFFALPALVSLFFALKGTRIEVDSEDSRILIAWD